MSAFVAMGAMFRRGEFSWHGPLKLSGNLISDLFLEVFTELQRLAISLFAQGASVCLSNDFTPSIEECTHR